MSGWPAMFLNVIGRCTRCGHACRLPYYDLRIMYGRPVVCAPCVRPDDGDAVTIGEA